MKTQKIMSPAFAVFNEHVNHAGKKAKKAFIQRFNQKVWDEVMEPHVRDGIMGIFQTSPTEYTRFYVDAVFCFVNENAGPSWREYK